LKNPGLKLKNCGPEKAKPKWRRPVLEKARPEMEKAWARKGQAEMEKVWA
jgi:hypothetical protein